MYSGLGRDPMASRYIYVANLKKFALAHYSHSGSLAGERERERERERDERERERERE